MIELGNHFSIEGRGRQTEWARQRRWFIKAKQDQQRREEIADKLEDNVMAVATEAIMATQMQIEEFTVKLDTYDEATVVALMENQKRLDAVQARIDTFLAQAYVMEDGRRVFVTEDGTQVFDEFGVEVAPNELDFSLIPETAPKWETVKADIDILQNLKAERAEILEFQDRVDAARERVAEGDISESDLEALDAELVDLMPASVREHVPGMEKPMPAPKLTSAFEGPAGIPAEKTVTGPEHAPIGPS